MLARQTRRGSKSLWRIASPMILLAMASFMGARADTAIVEDSAAGDELPLILAGRVESDGTEGNPDDVIFKVDGYPVHRKEWTTTLDYRRSLVKNPYPPIMMPKLVCEIVRRAAVRRHYQDRMPEIQARIDRVEALLEQARKDSGGSRIRLEQAFAKLAEWFSEDRSVLGSGRGGVAGTNFPHGVMRYPFDRIVFSLDEWAVSEPFPTIWGYHIVMPTRHLAGSDPTKDRCTARHILIAWDIFETRPQKLADRLLRSAKVEVVAPEFRAIVPPGLQAGPGKLLVIEDYPEDPWRDTILEKRKKQLARQAALREAGLGKQAADGGR